MTIEQTVRQLVEALELHGKQYPHMVKGYCVDAIAAGRTALAQMAAPVAAAVAPGLRQRIEQLIEQHGSLRAAARVLMVDVGYLSRLASGEKDDPGEDLLRRMKLRRVVSYESTAAPATQAAKPEPATRQELHDMVAKAAGTDFYSPPLHGSQQAPAQRLTQETIYRLWDGHTSNWPAGVRLREFEDIARVIESEVRAQAGDAQDAALPAVLFDGYAVLQALTPQAQRRTSGENVADTLDAVVRLIRAQIKEQP